MIGKLMASRRAKVIEAMELAKGLESWSAIVVRGRQPSVDLVLLPFLHLNPK